MPEPHGLATAQTWLFVPGDRPDRFAKAAASGADAVIVDLEDAVAAEDRAAALQHTAAALTAGLRALVRILPLDDPYADEQVAALLAADTAASLVGIVVPKAADPAGLARLVTVLGESRGVVALVESAQGVRDAAALAAVPGVARLAFGAFDYALDVDATAVLALDHARLALTVASRAAGLPGPVDSPPSSLTDAEAVAAHARHARELGLTAVLCVHPGQLAPVRAGLAPTAAELAWARGVVDSAGSADRARGHRGQLVDAPILQRARRILASGRG